MSSTDGFLLGERSGPSSALSYPVVRTAQHSVPTLSPAEPEGPVGDRTGQPASTVVRSGRCRLAAGAYLRVRRFQISDFRFFTVFRRN